jgi:hypothetical protein
MTNERIIKLHVTPLITAFTGLRVAVFPRRRHSGMKFMRQC